MLMLALTILGGLAGLFIGGELLVRGAVTMAQRMGMSPLVTGLVIVSAATSMPEMVASLQAALDGSPGIAWGNIVGSNLANALLILGATALVAPILLHGVGKRDSVVALLATLLLWAITVLQIGAAWIGAAILALLIVYVVWRVKHPPEATGDEELAGEDGIGKALLFFAAGVALLIIGGRWLVDGAVQLATIAGISETVIGLTIVAVGTSLPELAASLAAALKGRSDMAVGNVVGSNIYNILLIGGATMVVAPLPVPLEILDVEIPVLAASALLLVLVCRYASRIGRGLGGLLLAAFAANTTLLFA